MDFGRWTPRNENDGHIELVCANAMCSLVRQTFICQESNYVCRWMMRVSLIVVYFHQPPSFHFDPSAPQSDNCLLRRRPANGWRDFQPIIAALRLGAPWWLVVSLSLISMDETADELDLGADLDQHATLKMQHEAFSLQSIIWITLFYLK